jgi:hypothetical protein
VRLTGFVLLAAAAPAVADPFVVDFFPDGVKHDHIIMLGFLGPTEGTITETRLIVDFTTADDFDAANLFMLLVANAGEGFIAVTGADLGWSGPGSFSADVPYDDLNGALDTGVWVFDVYADVGDPPAYSGEFSMDTRWELDIIPVPAPATIALLLAAPTAVRRRRP